MRNMDGSELLGQIWRLGPNDDLSQRRAYGFLRLAELLREDEDKLGRVLAHAYAQLGAEPPETDHAESWARGDHPIQVAALVG